MMDRDNLLRLAIELYGKDAQMLMMIEEASELTKAICKVFRASDKDIGTANEHVLEEIADCKIMIRQMELIFGSTDGWESLKIHRLEELMNAHISQEEQP